MTIPTTAAGRALLATLQGMTPRGTNWLTLMGYAGEKIDGIEREAAAQERERIREAVERHEHGVLWDPRVSDPDSWTEEEFEVAGAVLASVYAILAEPTDD